MNICQNAIRVAACVREEMYIYMYVYSMERKYAGYLVNSKRLKRRRKINKKE